MSFRIMFDSTDPEAIPVTAELVAGYINGPDSQWPASAWLRFPHAQFVRINVTGDPAAGGNMLDVEQYDATPADAPRWYDAQPDHSGLGIYCSRDTLPAVEAAMGKRSYWRWIATLDGTLHIDGWQPMKGPAAIQFANSTMLGINADMSLVVNDGFHPAPHPALASLSPSLSAVRTAALAAQADATQFLGLLAKYGG